MPRPSRIPSLTVGNYACTLASVFVAAACAVAIVFLPDALDAVIKAQALITTDPETGDFTFSGHAWSKPPYIEHMNFYMFNWTNPITVLSGAGRPAVKEIGPFSYRQTDFKHNISFGDNGNWVRYKNYRSWYFDPSTSCAGCQDRNTLVTLPNIVYIGTAETLFLKWKADNTTANRNMMIAFSFATLLLGIKPYITVPVDEVIFNGYVDPILSVLDIIKRIPNKQVQKLLDSIIPASVLPLDKSAFFFKYNNSDDGWYTMNTGKTDASQTGHVLDWYMHPNLTGPDQPEWWTRDDARQLRGSDTGQVQQPLMTDKDKPYVFMSYWCRSFQLEPSGPVTVDGLNVYRYVVPPTVFNYTYNNGENAGFQTALDPDQPSCLMRIPCQPGQYVDLALPTVLSSPHFHDCNATVRAWVDGLDPTPEKYSMGYWDYMQKIGIPVAIELRQQINIPLVRHPYFTYLSQLNKSYVPILWLEESVHIDQGTRDYLNKNLQVLPVVAHVILYLLGIVAIICAILSLTCYHITAAVRSSKATRDTTASDQLIKSETATAADGEVERMTRTGSRHDTITHDQIVSPGSESSGSLPDTPVKTTAAPGLRRTGSRHDTITHDQIVAPDGDSTVSESTSLGEPQQQPPPPPPQKHRMKIYPPLQQVRAQVLPSAPRLPSDNEPPVVDRFASMRSTESYE